MSVEREGSAGRASAAATATHLDFDLELQRGGFQLHCSEQLPLSGVTAIFGPSGGGKTSLLRCIAGFERAVGRVAFGRQVWLDSRRGTFVPPHRRPVGFMFQEARLFRHLSVAGNLRFAAKRAPGGVPTFDGVVSALDLEALLARPAAALSGGERQRVALARTLLAKPSLLLLDEPLAALDAARKADILPYLEALPKHFGTPTLYVSHAIDEVARLADRVLVLVNGRKHAFGATAAVLERLDAQSIAGPLEAGVAVEARVTGRDMRYRLTLLDLAGQALATPLDEGLQTGATARLRIRARDVALATERPAGISIRNILRGTLAELAEDENTPFAEAVIDVGGQRLRARITRAAAADLRLAVGQSVFALVKSVSFEE